MKQELTDTLIHALENSQEGFDALKNSFNECAEAFELGDDPKGLNTLNAIIPPLKDFSNFCADMISTHASELDENLFNELSDNCESLQNSFSDLIQEMEDKNFVEVGDILKYDLGDITGKMADAFPKIAASLKKKLTLKN